MENRICTSVSSVMQIEWYHHWFTFITTDFIFIDQINTQILMMCSRRSKLVSRWKQNTVITTCCQTGCCDLYCFRRDKALPRFCMRIPAIKELVLKMFENLSVWAAKNALCEEHTAYQKFDSWSKTVRSELLSSSARLTWQLKDFNFPEIENPKAETLGWFERAPSE